MVNPFEDEEGDFLVLINAEGQFSLWPAWKHVPGGWQVTGPKGTRKECLDYIETTWTDMRPRSLIEKMNAESHGPGDREPVTPPSGSA